MSRWRRRERRTKTRRRGEGEQCSAVEEDRTEKGGLAHHTDDRAASVGELERIDPSIMRILLGEDQLVLQERKEGPQGGEEESEPAAPGDLLIHLHRAPPPVPGSEGRDQQSLGRRRRGNRWRRKRIGTVAPSGA